MKTAFVEGVDGKLVDVETAIALMRDTAARETRVRVRTALLALGYSQSLRDLGDWMGGHASARTIFVPSIRTTSFDLAIAMAYVESEFEGLVLGELSLDGKVRWCRGIIPMVRRAREAGIRTVIVPAGEGTREARMVEGMEVISVDTLEHALSGINVPVLERSLEEVGRPHRGRLPDRSDLPENLHASFDEALAKVRRGEHVLLRGPLACGKTMLARRIPTALEPMSPEHQFEVISIYNAAGLRAGPPAPRPFRAPHHTASTAALVGGGAMIRPGEMTLAHRGVLYLDDVTEFPRRTLEAVAHAARKGEVEHVRTNRVIKMPSQVRVVAATGLCPCGRTGTIRCRCTASMIESFERRWRWFVEELDMTVIDLPRRMK